jgi:hypothetical protein
MFLYPEAGMVVGMGVGVGLGVWQGQKGCLENRNVFMTKVSLYSLCQGDDARKRAKVMKK